MWTARQQLIQVKSLLVEFVEIIRVLGVLGLPCIWVLAPIFAIFWAMSLAWERGYRQVLIESDSALAVQKFHHPSLVRDPFSHVLSQCNRMLQRDWFCSLSHGRQIIVLILWPT